MRRIGQGARVFVVLSDKYLKSPYCMFELHEVWRTSRAEAKAFLERARVSSLPDAQIWIPVQRAGYAAFRKQQHDELSALVERKHGAELVGKLDFNRFRLMGDFYRHVSDILATMADIVQPRTLDELKTYGFDDLPPGMRSAIS